MMNPTPSTYWYCCFLLLALFLGSATSSEVDVTTLDDEEPGPSPTAPEAPPKRRAEVTGTVQERTRLAKHLFTEKKYEKIVNPDAVTVTFDVTMMNFDVDPSKQLLDTNIWLSLKWNDSRLHWDPTEFGGITYFQYSSSEVWKPDVTLYNSHINSGKMLSCWQKDDHPHIRSNGKITWIVPCRAVAYCPALIKLHKEPFEPVTCSLKFGSWTFDQHSLDMKLASNEIDLSSFVRTSDFEPVSSSAVRNERRYSCCEEPYVDTTYNLTLRRINL